MAKELDGKTYKIYGINGLYSNLLIVDLDLKQVIAVKNDWYEVFDEKTPEVHFLIDLCRKHMH